MKKTLLFYRAKGYQSLKSVREKREGDNKNETMDINSNRHPMFFFPLYGW
jgi:hypothetical protein